MGYRPMTLAYLAYCVAELDDLGKNAAYSTTPDYPTIARKGL
jgi:hypothetical protein